MGIAKEFREFAVKGNVIDLAVGVIIGASFQKIVDSIVADIIMPFVGILTGGYDFTKLVYKFGKAEVKYGNFIQASLNFLIVAFVLFMFIRTLNRLRRKHEAIEEAKKEGNPPPKV